MDDSAIARILFPAPDGEPPMRHRLGVVTAVNADGTLTVDVDGVSLVVSELEGAVASVDDVVQIAAWSGDSLALGRVQLATPKTYVPALTGSTSNPALGSGGSFTQEGRYHFLPGRMVTANVSLRFGTTGVGAGSGYYFISLPIAADATFHVIDTTPGVADSIGFGVLRDNTAGYTTAVPWLYSANAVALMLPTAGLVAHAVPWTWAASDAMNFSLTYRHA